jgi:diaminohydroxyphosphoribosylaminopyrimidine deaminase/5-amino-6-(5-phosphoribosylamino)uracil reductase
VSGVCEAEARQLNEVFVKYIRTRRPFVVLKCAATLDGQIATRTGDSKWVTGELARQHVHAVRPCHGCHPGGRRNRQKG